MYDIHQICKVEKNSLNFMLTIINVYVLNLSMRQNNERIYFFGICVVLNICISENLIDFLESFKKIEMSNRTFCQFILRKR